ncbi:MAG: protein tyrosine phosphatase [Cytophagia bacterium]|nr:MAG: protein tyrosine phosphatase [Runella slithyformis]TAG17697.1 MAG: protein tyrosine phosphatase [Cytophagales bacterium]TAG37311.1 MAG: protein tyrosine phosphatase [Cytophagia bacterium]TAG78277.1 MAG: protein tyrosine phosphatase [Cytophagales bacterium]
MCQTNVLFVCSRNKRRSLTAEMIWKNDECWDVKSCGTSESSRIKINENLLNWADMVLIMEKKHLSMIRQKFPNVAQNKPIRVLYIADVFELMDDKLIELLRSKCEELF